MFKSIGTQLYKICIDCHAEPDVLKEVKQKLDIGSVKFEVWHCL